MKIQGGSVKLPPSLWGQAYFLRAKRGNPVAVPDCFGTIVPRKDKKESAWERQGGCHCERSAAIPQLEF